jgi:predicted acyl esterase
VLPVSYVFKRGHRIRLELANGDHAATDSVFVHPYHQTLIGTDTIHHDAAHASCVMLPVVGPT